MKVTVTMLSNQDIFVLDVNGDIELENFKALCEFESGIPSNEIAILWNGRPLGESTKTLNGYGIKEGDILLLQRLQPGNTGAQRQSGGVPSQASGSSVPMIDFSNIAMPGSSAGQPRQARPAGRGAAADDPAILRDKILADPHQLSLLKERNPPLAEALLSGSLDKFKEVFEKQRQELLEKERNRIRLLTADPFDPEVQDKIAEEIRLKNVESNMETAMEYAPESFGQVVMLYINVNVNGHPVKAFVDSGAQMTIMSRACAERCSIMRLVDKRWAGVAKGVGEQKIIGRVHLCQIQIGPDFLQTSFSILEEQPMDMLLGLDMLKRHQCTIDLKRNKLVISTTGTETPFLAESDVPVHARLNREEQIPMDEDSQLAEAMNRSAQDASGTSSSSQSESSSEFPEANVKRLTDYGFPRPKVLEELRLANGNIDQALAALLAKSLTVPS